VKYQRGSGEKTEARRRAAGALVGCVPRKGRVLNNNQYPRYYLAQSYIYIYIWLGAQTNAICYPISVRSTQIKGRKPGKSFM
jgi:hypothetical protein